MATGRLGQAAGQRTHGAPIVEPPGSVQCMTCGDAGFVKRDDLAVTHPLFGQAIPCPHCAGARKNRNLALEGKWYATRNRLARPTFDASGEGGESPTPPADGFARTGVPVPTTVTEEQRERRRAQIARDVVAVAARMKVPR